MKDDDLIGLTIEKLRWLRLPGMARALSDILDAAREQNLSALDVVSRIADEEKASRLKSAVERRVRDARFPEINTIDGFDFDFDPLRKKLKARYLGLLDLTFIEKGVNPLFIGNPGTGKTFLVRALAHKACLATKRVIFISAPKMLNELHGAEVHGRFERALRKFAKADLLAIDDFACLEMDPTQAKLAFQVISERYDYRRPTAITTNRPFKEWPKVFPDALNAQVIAERLTERCEHFVLEKGYRTRNIKTSLPPCPSRQHLGTPVPSARRQVGEHARTFGTGPFTQRQVVPWSPLKPLVLVPSVTAGNSWIVLVALFMPAVYAGTWGWGRGRNGRTKLDRRLGWAACTAATMGVIGWFTMVTWVMLG